MPTTLERGGRTLRQKTGHSSWLYATRSRISSAAETFSIGGHASRQPSSTVVQAAAFHSAFIVPTIKRLRSLAASLTRGWPRSEEQTSELQSLMRISYAVFCLKKKKN